jgi:hypothetical protein
LGAELLSFLTPSCEKGFWVVVDALPDGVDGALEVGVAVLASGAAAAAAFDADGEDEEGLEPSWLSCSGFGEDGEGFPSFARRLARIYLPKSVSRTSAP